MNVMPQYGIPASLRPYQALMRKGIGRHQALIHDWIDDIVFTARYLCH